MPKFLKFLLLYTLLPLGAFAQCTSGSQNQANPAENCVQTLWYNATPSLTYLCEANAFQPLTTFYKSSGTLTNIVVSSGTAVATFNSTSYLWIGATIVVAGSTTTLVNGTFQITAVSGSTASWTTSAADGTYSNTPLTISTSSPLLNSPVWAIQVLKYNSTPSLTGVFWAGGPSVSVPHNLACSNRGNY